MKTLLISLSFLITALANSQNITNTLGTGGFFSIKDSSHYFLILDQSTGQVNINQSLRLENTTSPTTGTLFQGNSSFLHSYGTENTFLGISSGNFTMFNSAGGNTGLGSYSLYSLTVGGANTAVGDFSLHSNTTGSSNTALGHVSLINNTTGVSNTGVGRYSLFRNISGDSNTAVGYRSLYSNTNGSYNTASGNFSLNSNTTGNGNTALGNSSLTSNTTGGLNTAVGYLSLVSSTTGILNTALGYSTGSSITTGGNLTCIGYNAEPTSGTANNQVTLGNSSVTSLRCNVTTITSLSDARDKKNITDLSLGLDFLMKIKPRSFNWDKREWYDNNTSDGSKMKEEPTAGFIAQELDEVQTTENAEWLNLVLKDNPEKLEATYGNLLPVMVKAIQELKVESEKLRVASLTVIQENIELKNKNEILTAEVESLKAISEKIVSLERMINGMNSRQQTPLNEVKQIIISTPGVEK